jgi:ATP-dependent Lon protease
VDKAARRGGVVGFAGSEAKVAQDDPTGLRGETVLVPVLPLPDVCLFPESSLGLVVTRAHAVRAVEMAARAGGRLLAVAQKDSSSPNAPIRDLHAVGTIALIAEDTALSDGARRIELDGIRRARTVTLLGTEMLVAEVDLLDEGDAGDEWGGAVEALARYLHTHPDLRSFLDQQRRSKEPMSWVNLACQHLPITSTARQKLLDADARERCLKISRGLDALLRKEQAS